MHGADAEDQAEAESHLWCPCGCNQGLGDCNHIGCPSAPPMRGEVTQYLDEGLDVDAVLDRFEDKYGPEILTAPSTEGWFDLSVWIMPFVGLTAGMAGLGIYARRIRRRGVAVDATAGGAEAAPAPSRYDKRIEAELEDFTPED